VKLENLIRLVFHVFNSINWKRLFS